MQKEIEMVRAFHEAFECPVLEVPTVPHWERCELRLKLLREEVDELETAFNQDDPVETLDALTDIAYILFGTALECGMHDKLVDAFAEIHRSNMSKLDQNGNPVKRSDGKVIKSSLYTPPNLEPIIFNHNEH